MYSKGADSAIMERLGNVFSSEHKSESLSQNHLDWAIPDQNFYQHTL